MHILFLSQWFPYPPSNGSKLRILSLLRGLARRHEVTLLTFTDQPEVDPYAPELQTLCREVVVVPWKTFHPRSLKSSLGILSPVPRSLVDTYSPEMAQRIRESLAVTRFDLVIASELGTAVYGSCFRGVPALFEDVELGVFYDRYAKSRSLRQRFRHGLTWAKHRRYVGRILRSYGGCTVVSEQEGELVSKIAPGYGPIDVIPNCVNLLDYQDVRETPQPGSLVFTGSFRYSPNHEAMVWFLNDVLPLVKAACPDVRLTITGDPAGKLFPADESVTIAGFVDDVRPLLGRAWVSIAPLLTGGGTRLKILEAMASRTPVVATTKGAEGLEIRHGEHLLIADTPEGFARAVVSLLRNRELRDRLADNAYQLVRDKYDWAVVIPRFLDLVERVASPAK